MVREWHLMKSEHIASLAPLEMSPVDFGAPNTIEMNDGVHIEIQNTCRRKTTGNFQPSAFVPVVPVSHGPLPVSGSSTISMASMAVSLHVLLPNGVEYDLAARRTFERQGWPAAKPAAPRTRP